MSIAKRCPKCGEFIQVCECDQSMKKKKGKMKDNKMLNELNSWKVKEAKNFLIGNYGSGDVFRFKGVASVIHCQKIISIDLIIKPLLKYEEKENDYFKHKKGCIWGDDIEHAHLVPIDCYVPKTK